MTEAMRLGSIPLTPGTFPDCVEEVVRSAHERLPTHFHFVNAYTIALADSDPGYARLFDEASAVNFTDGMPVAWIGRRAYGLTAYQWPRVYGPDVMEAVLSRQEGFRHLLLGGSPDTLKTLQEVIAARWPQAVVAGALSPPFRAMTEEELIEQDSRISASGPDMIWVGLGTPKQDWEAARVAARLGIPALAVGAAFDFIAGTKRQAPRWMQRSGTEWAYRLATEPRRLGRRYLWGNPRFVLAVAKHPGLRGMCG